MSEWDFDNLNSMCDRTAEFEGIVQAIAPSAAPARNDQPAFGQISNTTPLSDFSKAVFAISRDFEKPRRRIEKITKLVEQRALYYNAPGNEINTVANGFSREVTELEQQLNLIKSWLQRNTTRSSQRRQHGEQVVEEYDFRVKFMKKCMENAIKKRSDVVKAKVERQTRFGVGKSQRKRSLELGSPLFNFAEAVDSSQRDANKAVPAHGGEPTLKPATGDSRISTNPQSSSLPVMSSAEGFTGSSVMRRRPRAGRIYRSLFYVKLH